MQPRTILILGTGMLLAATATPILAAAPAGTTMTTTTTATSMHRWGARTNGRWYAGWTAPGGWNGYRRPVYGFVLPRYWISPSFYIANYRAYGLAAPAQGYGWSRYYDDAVMTDQYGRVYATRSDIDWKRYEGGYDDANPAGTAQPIPAPRNAAAGAGYDYGYGYADDSVTYNNDYQGHWVGSWTGKDGTTYNGSYDGRFQGASRGTAGVDYSAPAYAGDTHWTPATPQPAYTAPSQGGYVSNGYYYPAPTVTTVVTEPAVPTRTTTTTTTTTYVTQPPARRRTAR